jgi:predicted RNA-binding Zn-ribbon protein involved in translation (DUF1610 family)
MTDFDSFSDWLGEEIETPICNNCNIEMEWLEEWIYICPVCGETETFHPGDHNCEDPDLEYDER